MDSAVQENEIMPFVITWMDLESIRLSEISRIKKKQIPDKLVESKQISKQNKHKASSQIQGIDGGCQKQEWGQKWMRGVKRCRFPVIE